MKRKIKNSKYLILLTYQIGNDILVSYIDMFIVYYC